MEIQANGQCSENLSKDHVSAGWYIWKPYQYDNATAAGIKLSGMDIELMNLFSKKLGINLEYKQINFYDHQQQMNKKKIDMFAGATYSDQRSQYIYFSVPYRYEENSLFVKSDNNKSLSFKSVSEFLSQVRLQNFLIGVTSGALYSDQQINLFINDSSNSDIVKKYTNDKDLLNALINGEIEGFLADRIVGGATILDAKVDHVKEIRLNVKAPIHLAFNKKTASAELIDSFNKEIDTLKNSAEYKSIFKTYVYPVLLLGTIKSDWFYWLGVIGTLAFAASGIAIAVKDNTTLFGTFLFAMLPSVGGGVMRDVLINREEAELFLTPSYIYYIIISVFIAFSSIRLLEYYNKGANEDKVVTKFWDTILLIGDALGQASFITTGVTVAIMARIEPIALWGPFLAFLTANGGLILRDILRKKSDISCLSGSISAEISIFWGLIFSIYLDKNSYNPDPDGIRDAVVFVAVGAFLTTIATHYFKIPNIRFRDSKE